MSRDADAQLVAALDQLRTLADAGRREHPAASDPVRWSTAHDLTTQAIRSYHKGRLAAQLPRRPAHTVRPASAVTTIVGGLLCFTAAMAGGIGGAPGIALGWVGGIGVLLVVSAGRRHALANHRGHGRRPVLRVVGGTATARGSSASIDGRWQPRARPSHHGDSA